MKKQKIYKITVWVLFALYALLVLYITLLSRSVQAEVSYEFIPFRAYRDWFRGSRTMGVLIIENILVFTPFGFLLSAGIYKRETVKAVSLLLKTALYSCLFSCGIELTQLFLRLGYCELDDVINNTAGAVLGSLLYIVIYKLVRNADRGVSA